MICQECGVYEGIVHQTYCSSYRERQVLQSTTVPWAEYTDTPILTKDRLDLLRIGLKVVCPTESGKHWTLVRYDDKSPFQRCNQLRSMAQQLCFAFEGHESGGISHLPMAEELDDRYGFRIVAIEYGLKGLDKIEEPNDL